MDEMCASCDATLRPAEEFCSQCGAPVVLRHSPRPRVRRGVVAAAVGGGTLISVLGVLLALVLLRPAPEPVAGESSAPPASATANAGRSSEPSSSPQSDPSSTPVPTESPPSTGALFNRAVAEVAVAGLNLRREPGGGAEVRGTLDEGATVFVIGAPQLLDDVAWYRVAVVDGPYSGCLNENYCPPEIGWVAEGGTTADSWLRPVALECPSSPMTAEELDALHPLERLSCYGSDEIVVTGTLDHCYCDANVPYTWEPFWLASPIGPFNFHATNSFVRWEEGQTPAALEPGDIVRATLAMEHEAAPTCTTTVAPEFFGPMPSGESRPVIDTPDDANTVLGCRTQLVVKGYEVIGFEDVSLPGG